MRRVDHDLDISKLMLNDICILENVIFQDEVSHMYADSTYYSLMQW